MRVAVILNAGAGSVGDDRNGARASGDGTVSTVAGALIGGDVPVAVLPLGTLNHFDGDGATIAQRFVHTEQAWSRTLP